MSLGEKSMSHDSESAGGERRWTVRPEGANWGEYGEDDQIGRLNLITPERRLAAFAEVREGRVFCLSLPLDCPRGGISPLRTPPVLRPTCRGEDPAMNLPFARYNEGQTDVLCDDRVDMGLQYSTQWDALAHIGSLFDPLGQGRQVISYYNGYAAGTHVRGPIDYLDGCAPRPGPYGAAALGIENMAETCVQGRGVMVDLHAHLGAGARAVGLDTLQQIMREDDVVIEPGDILCLRTGMDRALLAHYHGAGAPVDVNEHAGLDGRDPALLDWISRSGIAAILSDNMAVEAFGLRPRPAAGSALPLHEHCLFKLGLPLGEMFLLSDLADWLRDKGRSRFLLTAPPLRLPGAVGSPTTAVATV
jgi:kynurenine formamidase